MMILKLDSERLFNDFIEACVLPSANEAIKIVYNDIVKGLSGSSKVDKKAQDDVKQINAYISDARDKITTCCVSYAWAIMKSFGTGEKMDTSNPNLSEYISSEMWNPIRFGLNIVGREQGEYLNIFGEQAYSEGKKAGKSIGGWGKGISPSYAIQNAEKRLVAGLKEGGYVQRILDRNVESFFKEHPLSEYFYNSDE